MTFDRKVYQRQYMKGYMQKRRAPSDMCQGCDILNKYCNGPARSVIYTCRLDQVPPQTEKEEGIQNRARQDGIGPIFISDNLKEAIRRMRSAPDEPYEHVINRIIYGVCDKNIRVSKETLNRLQKLRLNDRESMEKMLNRVLDSAGK